MTYRSPLAALILAVSTMAMSAPAHAGSESAGARLATGVGYWIAAQGNAALHEIQEGFKKDLSERLQPILPKRQDTEQPRDEPTDSSAAL